MASLLFWRGFGDMDSVAQTWENRSLWWGFLFLYLLFTGRSGDGGKVRELNPISWMHVSLNLKTQFLWNGKLEVRVSKKIQIHTRDLQMTWRRWASNWGECCLFRKASMSSCFMLEWARMKRTPSGSQIFRLRPNFQLGLCFPFCKMTMRNCLDLLGPVFQFLCDTFLAIRLFKCILYSGLTQGKGFPGTQG